MAKNDPDECINILDTWIISEKNRIYDEIMQKDDRGNMILVEYEETVREFGYKVMKLVENETLQELNWPENLHECVKYPIIKNLILEEIEQWLVRFPYVKSRKHLEELEAMYSGVNAQKVNGKKK